jgi:hypothetical protein
VEESVVRSVVAIVLGGAAITALTAMANAVVFHGSTAAHMPPMLLAILLVMRGLAAIAGGYVSAAIARRRPVAHGLAAGVLYVFAMQLAPGTLALLSGASTPQALGTAATAIGITLVGAGLGGGARAQLRSSALEH